MAAIAPVAARTVAQVTLTEVTQHSDVLRSLMTTFCPKPLGAESTGIWLARTCLMFNGIARPSYLSTMDTEKARSASIPFFEVQSHVLKLQKNPGSLVLRCVWHSAISMTLFALNNKTLKDGSRLRDRRLGEDMWAETFRPLVEPIVEKLRSRYHPCCRFCPIPEVLKGRSAPASSDSYVDSTSAEASRALPRHTDVSETSSGAADVGGVESRSGSPVEREPHSCLLCTMKNGTYTSISRVLSGVLAEPFAPYFSRQYESESAMGNGDAFAMVHADAPTPTPHALPAHKTAAQPGPQETVATGMHAGRSAAASTSTAGSSETDSRPSKKTRI